MVHVFALEVDGHRDGFAGDEPPFVLGFFGVVDGDALVGDLLQKQAGDVQGGGAGVGGFFDEGVDCYSL